MDSDSHRQFPIVGILRAGQCGFVCLMLICCELAALGQDSKGSLRGSVQDASGGRLPGAKIVVQAKDFVGRREVLADKRGDFHIDGLMPGTYRVSASSKGFSETESDVEFFNVFNRNNPGNNYVTDISALPNPVNSLSNATALCLTADCSQTKPITSPKQLLVPAGALGDPFGPGTTVGIPFAAQLGVRATF